MYALNNPYNNNIKQTSIFNIRKRTKMAYLGYKNTYKNITINKYFACNNIKKNIKNITEEYPDCNWLILI